MTASAERQNARKNSTRDKAKTQIARDWSSGAFYTCHLALPRKFVGRGSKPPSFQGAQRLRRFSVSQLPFTKPNSWYASMEYTEQLGV